MERGIEEEGEMDKVSNAWIKELCGVTKGVDKGIDESILRWLGHTE